MSIEIMVQEKRDSCYNPQTLKTNKLRRRLLFTLLVALSWFGVFPATAHAWGSKGHQIIAIIARQRLSPRARKAVNELLNGQSLEVASNWAAPQKSSQASLFVRIPWDSNSYEPDKYCSDKNCLIEKIKEHRKDLENPRKSRLDRANALKYLLYLVGDLHQPFHCIDKDGKTIDVTFEKRPSTLFNVWESGLVEKPKMTAEDFVREIDNNGALQQKGFNVSRGTVVDWALESHSIARAVYVNRGEMRDDYFWKNKEVLNQQLYRAGVRLAHILNDIFR
jgi:nuclease S1